MVIFICQIVVGLLFAAGYLVVMEYESFQVAVLLGLGFISAQLYLLVWEAVNKD